MLGKLTEDDFSVLRKPLESKRQSPNTFAGIFILCLFLQALLLYIEFTLGEESIFPYTNQVFMFHIIVSIILGFLSFIYSIPAIYLRSQRIQYLISILISQNMFGVSAFILAILLLGADILVESQENVNTLMTFTYVTLIIGGIIFLLTCIRFYFMLINGEYRRNSQKDKFRRKLEKRSYVPIVIVGSTGLVLSMQYLIRNYGFMTFESVFIVALCLIIFFAMLFVLPEQLVILYCKYRFDSFNFDPNGRHLYPASDEQTNISSRKKINKK
ncbi:MULTISPECIES: hypothetical protein [Bacillaceae]|uniref:Uncharacterized protein n=1 Tax=Evansella alkalicola TaxID=745819 RepID=A0ABS6JY09_9BACI|nr:MULTISPECIES: hypothetical protein [Bacillaceae]MBU9723488.1 hypothetical protein [Bacillus alkalicola]